MDKVSSIAYVIYYTSDNLEIKQIAIKLLNGDVTIRELKMNSQYRPILAAAEKYMKQHPLAKNDIVQFISQFMAIEA